MAIKTSTFSGWRLSGKDADSFVKQIETVKANPKAKAALNRGRKLMDQYRTKGYVTLHATKNSTKKVTSKSRKIK